MLILEKDLRIALALVLLVPLAGCWEPKVVSEEYGRRCEALGYRFGSDAYVDCAVKLKEQGKDGTDRPPPAPTGVSEAAQICDKSGSSETPIARYLFKGDIVKDTRTDLTWQRCSVGQDWKKDAGCVGAPLLLTWDQAKVGANNGWRLPTKDELLTLVSPDCRFPAINAEAFPGVKAGAMWYWTGTPNGALAVWGVDFRDGRSSSADNDTAIGAARLVRSD